MNVLVTGASGAIGSALTKRLLEDHSTVYCQSRSEQTSQWGESWLRFELEGASAAFEQGPEWDVVFHLAGQTSIALARQDPLGALRDNVTSFVCLLEALRSQATKPLVISAGTATQVGLPDTVTIDGTLPDRPVTFYDVTKLGAEHFLLQYVREGWLRGCVLRLATVYGASSAKQAKDRGVIDKVTQAALRGEQLTVYGKGDYLRDYIHADDVVEAFVQAARHPDEVDGRSFLIGTARGLTVREAFECAADFAGSVTGTTVEVLTREPPAGLSPIDFRSAVVDPTPFQDATGWRPRYDLRSGLEKTYLS